MHDWLAPCSTWLEDAYRDARVQEGVVEFRWVDAMDLARETGPEQAGALALADADIAWLFIFVPYAPRQPINAWINQALGLRARLAREANYTGAAHAAAGEDTDAWQVGLVWLVARADDDAWQAEMATLRHESGASEELAFDRVLIEAAGVAAALDAHGLPRLLLASRQLLRKEATQVEHWLSADAQVAEQLTGFSERFDSALARRHAHWLEQQAAVREIAETGLAQVQQRFPGFRVENFRNLKALEIAGAAEEVAGIVLFGPNGTGKSSFIEALSLAVFKRCRRSDRYISLEKEETRHDGSRYLSRYLTPLDAGSLQPSFTWGNSRTQAFAVVAKDQSDGPEGVVLDQDESREFADLSAEELAEKVLGGYSKLAQQLSDDLDRLAATAKEAKLEFFRKYGLNSSITKLETAYDRLAREVLAQLKSAPSGFPEWAESIGHLNWPLASEAGMLAERWRQFRELPEKEAETLARLQMLGADQEISGLFASLLDRYNHLAGDTRAWLEQWEAGHADLKKEEGEILSRMDAWGHFLALPQALGQATAEAESQRKALEALALERVEIERRGKEVSARQVLLEQSVHYLERHWAQAHPDTCPVCASQIEGKEGIQAVVQALESACRQERDDLRIRYAALGKQQQALESRLKVQSTAICPVSASDQDKLRHWLTPFLGAESLEASLADPLLRDRLKSGVGQVSRLIARPEIYPDIRAESRRLVMEFQKLCDAADTVLAEPHALEEVRKAYQGILRDVLECHLPETLGRVWREMAHCLTAAHWLLPGMPALKLEPVRGRQQNHRLNMKVGNSDCLARHIYNAAELHTLGLAWFFTLHLARRRFDHAWIALDDPAQDLDQTSFRELTRFLATWLRIHRRSHQPHTLLLALHQEERALDAARATNAPLYLLGWREKQLESGPASPGVRRQILLAPGFFPKKPGSLFVADSLVMEGKG